MTERPFFCADPDGIPAHTESFGSPDVYELCDVCRRENQQESYRAEAGDLFEKARSSTVALSALERSSHSTIV